MRRIALIAVWLGLLCAAGSVEAREWRTLETPRYTVLSQLDERETFAWCEEFDDFIDSVSAVLKLRTEALTPLTVVLFADDKAFARYKPPRPNGRSASTVAGFFTQRSNWSIIALARRAADDETRRVIQHEAVHWLTNDQRANRPGWYTEGIAELFSTFRVRGDKVEFGHPINDHIEFLSSGPLMPIRPFLDRRSSIFDRPEHSGQYYAQSWLLVHYLLLGNVPERREQLLKFLAARRTQTFTGNAPDAAATVFGDPAVLEDELNLYLTRRLYGYSIQPRQQRSKPARAMVAASPAMVEATLGKAALGAADPSVASAHLAQLEALNPSISAPSELRAYIALRDDQGEAAVAAARSALATGSRDPWMFQVVGDAMAQNPADSRRRVSMYERAINLDPTGLAGYRRLIDALQGEMPTTADLQFIELGRQAFPQAGMFEIELALVARQKGDAAGASAHLDKALLLQLTAEQRKFADDLRSAWAPANSNATAERD